MRAVRLVVALALLVGVATAGARDAAIEVGGRRVTLELRANEPVLVLRSDGPLAVDALATALPSLLATLFPDGVLPADVRSLSAGRIESMPWLSERLALAAARDPAWKRSTSRDENGVVARLLRDRVHELAAPFARYGLVTPSVSVEKVLSSRADLLPFADRLRAAGIAGDARVPFDAQLWLRFGAR